MAGHLQPDDAAADAHGDFGCVCRARRISRFVITKPETSPPSHTRDRRHRRSEPVAIHEPRGGKDLAARRDREISPSLPRIFPSAEKPSRRALIAAPTPRTSVPDHAVPSARRPSRGRTDTFSSRRNPRVQRRRDTAWRSRRGLLWWGCSPHSGTCRRGRAFDQRRAQARLSRALRTKIAARPAADHDQIKLLHNRTSCRFLQSSMPRRSFEMLFVIFVFCFVVSCCFLRIKLPAKRCRPTNPACTFYRWQIFQGN